MQLVPRLSALLAAASLVLYLPVTPASAEASAEQADLDFVIDVLRRDYAGYEDKVSGEKEEEFQRQVALARSRIEERPDAFVHAISGLLDSFKDSHLGVRSFVVSPKDPWPEAEESQRTRDFPGLNQEFGFQRLSEKTVYLRVPHFDSSGAETFHALLEKHHDEIVSTPNLLIDMRDNGGGQDFVYAPLMAYLYTRPIYSIGPEIRVSERNLAFLEDLLANPETPDATREFLEGFIEEVRTAKGGSWVPLWDRGFTISTYPKVHAMPRRVGILAEGAGSAGDQFVIDARSSRKVTILGGPTHGVIDYSNVISAKAPSERLEVYYPISRSMRLPEEPFDNIGVQPDIPFGPEVEDHVAAAQDWLERQVD